MKLSSINFQKLMVPIFLIQSQPNICTQQVGPSHDKIFITDKPTQTTDFYLSFFIFQILLQLVSHEVNSGAAIYVYICMYLKCIAISNE